MSKKTTTTSRHSPLRVAVITGTRAEFGLLEPVLRAMQHHRRLQPRLIVTGMHLLPKFGRTINQIREAGWRIDAVVRMQTGGQGPANEAQALARGVAGISRSLDRLACQAVLVLGDRVEAFAGACAATVGRRMLCHIHGGDRAIGDLDDIYRDTISRMAHVHLAASREAAARLRRMGEEPRRIHLVGAPGLDEIRTFCGQEKANRRRSLARLRALIGPLADHPYAVVIQHPIGRPDRTEAVTMRRLLNALKAEKLTGAIIYPNSDAGHQGIIREIQRWQRQERWPVFRSLLRQDYLLLARHAAVMVGNSSSGIIESASLGLPAVNVGIRQNGRLRCGPSVIDAPDHLVAIQKAIRRARRAPRPRPARSVYGHGRAGQRIAAILGRLIATPTLLKKRFTF